MRLSDWLRPRKRHASPPIRNPRRSKASTTRLSLEPLEDRTLLSVGWAISYGAPGSADNQPAISALDANSDFYVTGYFNGTATFGSTTLNASTESTYVAKVDSSTGNFLWATEIGGSALAPYTGIPAITLDGSGNVYAAGNFGGTSSFGSTTLTSAGGTDIYICKLDPTSGTIDWAEQAGGTANDDVRAMTVDPNGNVFVTGMFDGGGNTSSMVPPGTTASATFGSTTLTATCSNGLASAPVFLTELDSNGNFLHTDQLLGGTDGQPFGIAADNSGNVYVVGSASGFMGSNNNGFIEKVTPSAFTVDWAQGMSGHIGDGAAVYQDPTTGATLLYVSMNSGIEKLDATSGSVLWSKSFGGSSVAQARGAMAVDANGNVYVTGEYSGTVDFDPDTGTAALTSAAGSEDTFLYKFGPSGNFLSAQSMGGPGYDMGCGLALDSSGDIYTVGNYQNTATFDTGSQTVSLTSPISASSFLCKTTQDTGTIFGRVFNDLNNNGVFDAGSLESGIPNVTLYLDLNNSGSYVAGDPTATTDSQGYYHFSDVAPGSYPVRQIAPSGYTATPASFTVSVTAGQASETTGFADYTPNKTRTYTNTTAVKTSAGKPNAVSSLTVPDSYTVLGMTLSLNVSNSKHQNLSIYLTGPNGTKVSLGSTNQSGALSFQVPYFDYTAVKGTWTLEVDGLAGGTLNNWSMNIDGTLS